MKVQEYVAKRILDKHGLRVPKSIFVTSYNEEVEKGLLKLGFPVVLKSQVLVGGRMKAGGVLFAHTLEEAKEGIEHLLSKPIKGELPEGVLVEELVEHDEEWYISLSVDRTLRDILFIFSKFGGVDIEEISTREPEKVIKTTDITNLPRVVQPLAKTLLEIFLEYDLTLLEINPIGVSNGILYMLDAVFHVDENALFRQTWVKKDGAEHFVRLDGDIGVIGCGAGIVMATIDVLKEHGLEPANFYDIGGGASREELLKALDTVCGFSNIVVLNIFGGITDTLEVAKGIVEFSKSNPQVQLFVRLSGTHEDEARKYLLENGITCASDMKELMAQLLQWKEGKVGESHVLEAR
ncbi:ATP-grasp domain-containing protein [Fervidobacterium thailandense]|uniref:Succinate--CoA ligase n=1 Tax=Fervidobacterium thailandense TaxID=1008305 RepID=A0A1E3G2K2_9BACT|nr:ATP-grasp domain-containing protein [Fervidobacterium thailandense]ODN30521.1 succinate--CoA ligase [Fervidobacterium thailandense]